MGALFPLPAQPRPMKVRGRRECTDCGARWSYYETGSITCPDCGGVESVGVGDRELHTDAPASLDLTPVRARVDADPLADVTAAAKEICRAYLRERGFLHGGDLLALDDTYLAARELVEVADVVGRGQRLREDEEAYLLSLLADADDGERPAPGETPETLRAARGLAVARAVETYLRECRDWLAETPRPAAEPAVERLDDHVRRVLALQGDVDPADAERLVEAARQLATYIRDDDEAALDAVEARLDALE
jgi:hypothetical protein